MQSVFFIVRCYSGPDFPHAIWIWSIYCNGRPQWISVIYKGNRQRPQKNFGVSRQSRGRFLPCLAVSRVRFSLSFTPCLWCLILPAPHARSRHPVLDMAYQSGTVYRPLHARLCNILSTAHQQPLLHFPATDAMDSATISGCVPVSVVVLWLKYARRSNGTQKGHATHLNWHIMICVGICYTYLKRTTYPFEPACF